ncbi:uncharacterized protein RCO7_02190 [Rhynchosporium graminicola]|uniref:Uncharacterized protein n=1 Tax=Rhynchosporium graminicola TaxID=2792576 RepID=A0A1E1LJ72_9HELO|nr:uncharacterized protein RCO7_02190 [Rhynchosporium commune]
MFSAERSFKKPLAIFHTSNEMGHKWRERHPNNPSAISDKKATEITYGHHCSYLCMWSTLLHSIRQLCDHFTSPPSKAQSFETGYIQCEKDEPIIDKPLPPNPASTASTFKSYLDARGSQRTSPESSVLLVRGTTLRLRAFQEPVDCSDTEEVHELPADEPVSGEVSGSPVEVKLQQTIDSILEQHNKERMEGREITVGERGHKTIRHVGAAPPAV